MVVSVPRKKWWDSEKQDQLGREGGQQECTMRQRPPRGQVWLGPIGKLCKKCRAHLRVVPVGEHVGDYIPFAPSAPALPTQKLREELPAAREHADWCTQEQ